MHKEQVIVYSKTLSKEEYIQQLKNKMVEEAHEVLESNSRDNLITELADVLEVISALAKAGDLSMKEIRATQRKKRDENGYFHHENYINYIEVAQDNRKVIEYMENKNRHYRS
jgi:predicted house-cleaning noncanonical NTP pyrophosphatase (MazG superfamily)